MEFMKTEACMNTQLVMTIEPAYEIEDDSVHCPRSIMANILT